MKILKKTSADVPSFLAGDNTILKEVLHPKNDGVKLPYSIAQALLKPGKASTPHRLSSAEVYYILEGKGKVFIDDESTNLAPGDLVLVPKDANQYVLNTGDVDIVFLCIVSPPWSPEGEIVE